MYIYILGANIYPTGPTSIRSILEIIYVILIISDLFSSSIVLIDSYCLGSNDFGNCDKHDYFLWILSIWPLAIIITPLMGLIMMILGPSVTLAKSYASWLRVTFINSSILIWVIIINYSQLFKLQGQLYPFFVLLSSRLFQMLTIDIYIAYIEKIRYTRGWDGLQTSLYKTRDRRIEIIQ